VTVPRRGRVLHIQKVGGIAGSENHLLTLLPGLRRVGYEPTMLVLDGEGRAEAFTREMRARGVPTRLVGIRAHVDPALPLVLARHVRPRDYDIVHTHLIHADLYGALAARVVGHGRLVSTRHCCDPWRRNAGYAILDRASGRLQRRIIAISRGLQEQLCAGKGLPAAKVRVVHYGLDADEFRRQAATTSGLEALPRPVVGTVSRLIPEKGVHLLLEAFDACAREFGADAGSLVVVGDGPARAALEADARRRPVAGRVHFTGHLPRSGVSAAIRAFDVFVFPTFFPEGFGLVLLEAMAWGKPIVASRAISVPEILAHDRTGLVVPPEDAGALRDALLRLRREPGLGERLGAAGRLEVEQRFGAERMIEETARVYDELRG
jgi:glycosyltransferase involved in cell wall biosynthesis